MRSRLTIVATIALVLMILVGLNAASYVRVERPPDTEIAPDRSISNAGATGTRALYEFLRESGHKVIPWREPPASLLRNNMAQPATFVIVGATRVPVKEDEAQSLLLWVARGGRLVIIDRAPRADLLVTLSRWHISAEQSQYSPINADPRDAEAMTRGASALAPAQPTLLTRDVERVAPSRFASRLVLVGTKEPVAPVIKFRGGGTGRASPARTDRITGAGVQVSNSAQEKLEEEPPPPPAPRGYSSPRGPVIKAPAPPEQVSEGDTISTAPVIRLGDDRGALLLDYARGKGRIIVLSDPFIVANDGISRADNLQLAVNILAGASGLIAFDEYHQGRGATQNLTLAYFAGTPIIMMLAQVGLIALVIVWTRGRRFARPLPMPHIDRRSKLEFVASMAELQQRARAYDLAIENIYGRTRRALARYGGTAMNAPRNEIAARVAARSGINKDKLESLMRECEDTIAGAPTRARASVMLAARLREVERTLGIRMRKREVRQAARL